MDFNTWAATKKPVTGATSKDFASLYGEDAKGFEYAEGFIQCVQGGSFYTYFGNMEITSDQLEKVEHFLFSQIGE